MIDLVGISKEAWKNWHSFFFKFPLISFFYSELNLPRGFDFHLSLPAINARSTKVHQTHQTTRLRRQQRSFLTMQYERNLREAINGPSNKTDITRRTHAIGHCILLQALFDQLRIRGLHFLSCIAQLREDQSNIAVFKCTLCVTSTPSNGLGYDIETGGCISLGIRIWGFSFWYVCTHTPTHTSSPCRQIIRKKDVKLTVSFFHADSCRNYSVYKIADHKMRSRQCIFWLQYRFCVLALPIFCTGLFGRLRVQKRAFVLDC